MVEVSWSQAVKGWVTINFPEGSMLIVMSVLGAVVMPHNLFFVIRKLSKAGNGIKKMMR